MAKTVPGLFVVDLRTLHSADVCCCNTGGGGGGGVGDRGAAGAKSLMLN